VINATPRPLYPWEGPGTYCIDGCTNTIKMELRGIKCEFVNRTELLQKIIYWQALIKPGIKLVGCVKLQVFRD
jgi:hypothetical protein